MKVITIMLVCLFSYSCCNQDRPSIVAVLQIEFEGISDDDLCTAWIIETDRDNYDIVID
jgi:hypothetical protein